MKPDSIIILVLVFTIITIAIGGIIGDLNNNYGVNASTSFANKYNFADDINNTVSGIAKDTESAGKESGWLSVLSGASAVLQATISTVLLVLKVPFYITSIIRGVAADIGMPPVVSMMIIPIFIVMVIVGIVFMIIRFIRGENV